MQRETALLPAGAGQNFRAAIETDRLAEFVANTPAGGDAQNSCRLTLEYAAPLTTWCVATQLICPWRSRPQSGRGICSGTRRQSAKGARVPTSHRAALQSLGDGSGGSFNV